MQPIWGRYSYKREGHSIRDGPKPIVHTQIIGHYDAKLLIQGTIMVSLTSKQFN